MNTDIRLSVGFWQHPKTKKIVKRLGLEGVRSLQVLWLWAAVNRPDGILSGMDWEDIELAADWQGEDREFFDFCLGVWIDEDHGEYSLHDWTEHNSWAAEAEDRSDKARFSRLAQVNPVAHAGLKAQGISAIGKEEYGRLANAKRTPATSSPDSGERQANASAPLAPSPSPAPNALREHPNGCLSPDAEASDAAPASENGFPPCPHQEIIALYHEILPELPKVKTWNGQRPKHLAARWKETLVRLKQNGQEHDTAAGLDWWRKFFQHRVRPSPLLMGKIPKKGGGFWSASLPWLILPDNYAKTLENNYRDWRLTA